VLPDQDTIKAYHVYTYTFLDDLSFVESPYRRFRYEERKRVDDAMHLISSRFKECGWEGDGAIGIIWLPPFVDVGTEDTWGTYVWHVKQQNNGISFLACEVPLVFERLAKQNEGLITGQHAYVKTPITIVETCVNVFREAIANAKKEMTESLTFLKAVDDASARTVSANLLCHYQGTLVQYFYDFLDECYLQVLIEAIESGNPHHITLRKSTVKVNPSSYLPTAEEVEGQDIASASSWFTIRGFISDLWKAYKWEPFKSKIEMLFRSLDYAPPEPDLFELKKHVVIRNCMEHHQGCLDRDSLEELGRAALTLADEEGTLTICVWKPITLTEREVLAFMDLLVRFAGEFHQHVGTRIPTRYFLVKPC
jgi:hypothetical protein